MAHKAFEVVGERVLIIPQGSRKKERIFQESELYRTVAEGTPRPALDFVEPIYEPNPIIEDLARGINPRERIHEENPILSLHLGVDHLGLRYMGREQNVHVFTGEMRYEKGLFLNDGNFEAFNKYKEPKVALCSRGIKATVKYLCPAL